MALVRNTQNTVEIPHEPGHFATIRRVRRSVLEIAADIRSEAAIAKVQRLGGPKVIAEMTAAATKQEQPEKTKRPSDAFDVQTLLVEGLVALTGDLYEGVTVDADVCADLDEETAAFIADQIAAFAAGGARAKNG